MKTVDETIRKQIRAFCARISADTLLVQGAGGNVSWKDGDVLWVKASGTWLADAEAKDIFVSVNLAHLRQAISSHEFSITPKVIGNSALRPSIETLLHALMPQRVVVHLHAVEILAHLVRANAEKDLQKHVGNKVNWVLVNYYKPGADLAEAVAQELAKSPASNVVFLRNHGVVIGGLDIACIEHTLETMLSLLQTKPQPFAEKGKRKCSNRFIESGYFRCAEEDINQLAINEEFSSRLQVEWALYPDHVVFLGGEAAIFDPDSNSGSPDISWSTKPPFIFVLGEGAYESGSVTLAQKAQLRCYYDVLARQAKIQKLSALNKSQALDLLDWDAEKYRQKKFG